MKFREFQEQMLLTGRPMHVLVGELEKTQLEALHQDLNLRVLGEGFSGLPALVTRELGKYCEPFAAGLIAA